MTEGEIREQENFSLRVTKVERMHGQGLKTMKLHLGEAIKG